jgi:hypothetical protein
MRTASVLADLVVVVHLAYLGYVVLGGYLGLRDVRWLIPHLAASAWGVIGTITRLPCPLTGLEKSLDTLAGASTYDGPFIAHYLAGTLYPANTQPLVWQATAAVVAASYVVSLVHHQRRRAADPGHPAGVSAASNGKDPCHGPAGAVV